VRTAQRRAYRALLRAKREEFWQNKVNSERLFPRQLWRSVDMLLGRGRVPPCGAIDVAEFRRYFDDKVAGVRASTSDAPPPTFTPAPSGCQLLEFRPLTADDIVAAVPALPDKQCMSDPLPTRLLNNNVDVLAPFLVELYNCTTAPCRLVWYRLRLRQPTSPRCRKKLTWTQPT